MKKSLVKFNFKKYIHIHSITYIIYMSYKGKICFNHACILANKCPTIYT